MIIILWDNQMTIFENGFDAWRRNINRFLIISTRYQIWSIIAPVLGHSNEMQIKADCLRWVLATLEDEKLSVTELFMFCVRPSPFYS